MLRKLPLAMAISSTLFLTACGSDNDDTKVEGSQLPKTHIKLAVVTDTHVYDASLGNDETGDLFTEAIASDRKAFLQSQRLLDTAIDQMIASGTEILLVPGDLTKDGERINHKTVRDSLLRARQAGIKVYVVPGNHDMNNPYGYKESLSQTLTAKGSVYLEGNAFGVEAGSLAPHMTNITGAPLFMENWDQFYADFGFDDAIFRDPNSFSFVAEPYEGLWVMAIDAINSSIKDVQQHWKDGNDNYNKTGGSLLAPERQATFDWVKEMAAKAKAENKVLVAISHAGVVEHFPGKSALIANYVIDGVANEFTKDLDIPEYRENYVNSYTNENGEFVYNTPSEYISRELAKAGVNLVFSGHFHANDIAKREYEDGSWIYDIQTGASVSYPAPYRSLLLDLQQKRLITEVDTDTVMNTVPEADLIGLVDGLSENIFAALGVPLEGPLLEILDNTLTKKPIAQTMLDVYIRENKRCPILKPCDDAAKEALRLEFIAAELPEGISWDELYDTTLSQLIAEVLKAHYHGNETEWDKLGQKEKFVLDWARRYGERHASTSAELKAEITELNQHPALLDWDPSKDMSTILGDKVLGQLYGLLAQVGEGIIYDPIPDLNLIINLEDGSFDPAA